MAKYNAIIATRQAPEEVFSYLADFSNASEWDPGVKKAERLGRGAIKEGSEFLITADFLGRSTTLTYRIVEHRPSSAVTFRGENSTAVSLDRITCEPFGGGTRVTYNADLSLKGPLGLADPLLALAFRRVGDRALAGLRATLTA
jgi:carbon monoxide dehydrogenase subunit G